MEYYGDSQMRETIQFVSIFDRFFDCLNTRHPREGFFKRKPDLNPYSSPTDARLKVQYYDTNCTHIINNHQLYIPVAGGRCARVPQ